MRRRSVATTTDTTLNVHVGIVENAGFAVAMAHKAGPSDAAGCNDGWLVGCALGCDVGRDIGCPLGCDVGSVVGCVVGCELR